MQSREQPDNLGVHKSTISRELRRNRGKRGYRPRQAHMLAETRRNCCANRIAQQTWTRVEELPREERSPQQISGWLAMNEGTYKEPRLDRPAPRRGV